MAKPAWYVICEDDLRELLQRCGAGEDVEIVLAEHYANCRHEFVDGDRDAENG